jgi:hypothetical protein
VHHYCLLAVVDFAGGSFANPIDCRDLFPPLTAIAASDVSYDPAACANLGGARTVQEAIDILCRGTGGVEPGIHIQSVRLMSGRELQNDSLVDPQELSRGIRITCDRPPFQDSVRNRKGLPNPVCRLTLDLPWPITGIEREIWKVASSGVVGFQPTTLSATVNSDGNDIFWVPGTQAPNNVQQWLADSVLSVVLAQTHGQIERVLARLTLEGNFIWGRTDREEYLDGDTFGVRGDQATAITLASGDGRRGGNFEMWFWLAAPPTPTPTVTTPTVTATFTRPTLTATVVPTLTFTRPILTQPIATATLVGPIRSPVGGGPSVIVPRGPDRRRATSRPLSAVEGLSRAQARKLQAAGIRDAVTLAGSDPRDVAAILALRDRATAAALVEAAKRLSPPP